MNNAQLTAVREIAAQPRFRIQRVGSPGSGSPKRFVVEQYAPAPGRFPWLQVAGPFSSYAAAEEAASVLGKAV